ncbi:hypothetical protein MHTCC0001_35110 [Flavobacteriaceae bacterium MHTCC 0001]
MKVLIWIIIDITLLILTFLIIKRVFNKNKIFQSNKKLNILSSGLLAIVLNLFLFGIVILFMVKPVAINFDKQQWLQKKEIRYQMVDDLIENKYIIGKSKQDVIKLIGQPDSIETNDNIWVYNIIGKTWADFTKIELRVLFKESKGEKVEKKLRII